MVEIWGVGNAYLMVAKEEESARGEEGSWDWDPKIPLTDLPTTT